MKLQYLDDILHSTFRHITRIHDDNSASTITVLLRKQQPTSLRGSLTDRSLLFALHVPSLLTSSCPTQNAVYPLTSRRLFS
jgi:hypothetical protein